MNTKECLIAARDYILKHGWCRYEYNLPDGRVCMLGALSATGAYDHPEVKALATLRRVIRAKVEVAPSLSPIPFFNDNVAKDIVDVIAVFNDAIEAES